jgi:hypothetical protein
MVPAGYITYVVSRGGSQIPVFFSDFNFIILGSCVRLVILVIFFGRGGAITLIWLWV